MKRIQKFILNGVLVTIVSLTMRSVAVSFNIYLSNRIGAVAMGLFTLISTVYGFSITLATSGIGLASTKLVAEALTDQEGQLPSFKISQTVRCIVKKCVAYALFFGIGSALLLFFFAPTIGSCILKDIRTVMPLQVLAFTLPPIALSAVFNGYFIAVRRVYKNAVVQIAGQMIRIFGCIVLLAIFGADDVQSACLAIAWGGALSEGGSFLLQYALYLREKQEIGLKSVSSKEIIEIKKNIRGTALPVAWSAYVRSGLVTFEHMLIPWGLEKSGTSRDMSLASYGIIHSMVFPLILFPSALSASFAGLLVPEIAEAYSAHRHERINWVIDKVFHSVLIFSIGTAGIMMCFSYALADTIYPQAGAGRYILMIAPLIPVMYLDTAIDALLKGMGEQFYCMVVNIVDALFSVILVWMLIPKFGIYGYIITVYFTEIINATLSIARLLTVSKISPHPIRWVIKPLGCILISTMGVRHALSFASVEISTLSKLIIYIMITVLLYLLLLIVTKCIRIRKAWR